MRAQTDWPRDIVGAKKDTTASRPPIKRNAGSEFREYSPYLLTSQRMFSNTALPISVFMAACPLTAFFRRHSTPRSCQRRVASSDWGKAILKGYQLADHAPGPTRSQPPPTGTPRPHAHTHARAGARAHTHAHTHVPCGRTRTRQHRHTHTRAIGSPSLTVRTVRSLVFGIARITRRPVPQRASRGPGRGWRFSPAWARGRECIRSRPPPQSQGFPP